MKSKFLSKLVSFVAVYWVSLMAGLDHGQALFGYPQEVDFSRDIKPILSNKCFTCHGPDEETRESGLRLDTFEGATDDGSGYPAIVPFDVEESELIQRIESDDDSMVMPPPEHGNALSPKEISLLKAWIASGAQYQPHWAYVAPQRPELPAADTQVGLANWPQNAIDHFVLEAMQRRALEPEPEADRFALIRRLSLDLTGLPPTPQQADDFFNDTSPDAYEKVVDRLLGSPAYAEHWAAKWLDLARYADSAGYAEDHLRTIWPYRDWVIRSFAQNQPFDQFTIDQIAGDLRPDPQQDQLIATAFHRNTLTNSEGGTDDEEFRSAAVVDRANTTMAVWMGTTLACAQCHTHKYDPITHHEYFQLYAILNNTADNDQPSEAPVLELFSDTQLATIKLAEAEIQQLQQQLQSILSEPPQVLEQNRQREQQTWEATVLNDLNSATTGQVVRISLPGQGRMIQLAEVQVISSSVNVAVKGTATQSSTYQNGTALLAIDGNTDGQYDKGSVSHTQGETNPWWQVDLGQEHEIDEVVVWNRTDGNLFRRLDGFEISILAPSGKTVAVQRFPQASKESLSISWRNEPRDIEAIVQKPAADRNPDEHKKLTDYFMEHRSAESQIRQQIGFQESTIKQMAPESTVPVLIELDKPRETFVHIRGSYLQPGDQVQPGVPAAFHQLEPEWLIHNQPPNRMALAKWLVDRDNPLTARVIVNRYWEQLFGRGIVLTSEDFGIQGDLPTHPELLDYLAIEFMDNGWDNRAILKQIVMSATYRQSSLVTPEKQAADGANVWLSRGPRVRVSAETVRDQALFVSGLLSRKMFGQPVRPPAPDLGLKAAFAGDITWQESEGEDRHRRAIYTQWRRSSPYPSMETFDMSNREVCDLRRINTNTPLQALVTLNDEVYIEAAQALAKMMVDNRDDPTEIASIGFRQALIRHPSNEELEMLVELFDDCRQHYLQFPDDARRLAGLKMATELNAADESSARQVVDLAAWTTVANVMLNLDEFFQKR